MNHRTGTTLSIRPVEVAKNLNPQKVSEYFGVNTFSEVTMKKMVPLPTFKSFKKWQEGGAVIGMTGFGASAPAAALYRHFGITSDAAVAAAKSRL